MNDEPTRNERLYRAFQNWAEFGCWLSGGLLLVLIARQIPAMRVVVVLAYIGFAAFAYLNREGDRRVELGAIALALALALIGGLWDFARDLFVWAIAPLL